MPRGFSLTKGRTWRGKWYRSDADAFHCAYCELLQHPYVYEPNDEGDNYIPDMKRKNPPGPPPFGGMPHWQENKCVIDTADFAPDEAKVDRGMNGIGDPVIFMGITNRLIINDPNHCPIAMARKERVAGISGAAFQVKGGCRAWIYIRQWPPPLGRQEPPWILWNHCWPLPPGYWKVPAGPQISLWKDAKRKVETELQAEELPFNLNSMTFEKDQTSQHEIS